MQVDADSNSPPSQHQSFSAAFELLGTPDIGELTFFTPLGNTAAVIRWKANQATLDARGETRNYDGLDSLIASLLGTDVPVAALFAWLSGKYLPANGWQADLSEFAQGKVSALRLTPLPRAQLRLILEP